MSRYTRFSKSDADELGAFTNQRDFRREQAERLFHDLPVRAVTPFDRTSHAARQIVQDAADKRQNLTDALRAARLERAARAAGANEKPRTET